MKTTITKNKYDHCFELIKDEDVNGEWLTLTVSHTLDLMNPNMSGWFVSIVTHDWETGEPDWGFCAGFLPSYPEAIAALKSHPAYERYPFPC